MLTTNWLAWTGCKPLQMDFEHTHLVTLVWSKNKRKRKTDPEKIIQ